MNSLMETDLASGLEFLHDKNNTFCLNSNSTGAIPNPTEGCKFDESFWRASVKGLRAREIALLVFEILCLVAMVICFFRSKGKLLKFAIFATALALVLAIISIIMKRLFDIIQLYYIILFIFLGLSWRGAEWSAALLIKQMIEAAVNKNSSYLNMFRKALTALKICLGIIIALSLASYALTTAFNVMFLLRWKGHKYDNIERYLVIAKKVTFAYAVMFALFAAAALATLMPAIRFGAADITKPTQKRCLYIATVALLIRGLEQIVVTSIPAFVSYYDSITLKLADAFAYNISTAIMFWFLVQYARNVTAESSLATVSETTSDHGTRPFDGGSIADKKTATATTYAMSDDERENHTDHSVSPVIPVSNPASYHF